MTAATFSLPILQPIKITDVRLLDKVQMEFQQDSNQPQNDVEALLSRRVGYCILGGIGLLVLLGFLLFGTISTELTCVRSPLGSVECSLIENTTFFKMSPVIISNPLAVDVIKSGQKSPIYIAEIRSANPSYTLTLASTHTYKTAQNIADEVNDFLLRSNAASFSQKFPERRKPA